jgi:hypothetical protein
VRSSSADAAQVWQQTALDAEVSQPILAAAKARDQARYREVQQLRELASDRGWRGGW